MAETEAGVDAARAAVELKSRREELKNFIAETHRRMDSSRTSVSGFGRSAAAKTNWMYKNRTLTNTNGQLIIKVEKSDVRGPANEITQKINAKGGIDRNYYDSREKQIKQISNNGHGHKKEEAMGINGEHAHDYDWDENGHPIHKIARELADEERMENDDIIKHDKDHKRNSH